MGRCTVADSEAYAALMDTCNHNAARVLREYAYFSPELKAILEKVAAIQAKEQSRGTQGNLFQSPQKSPWGEVQHCDPLCPGVFMVTTPGHGGILVSKEIAAVLSPAARKSGFQQGGYLCFEEDTQEHIVLRELLDKKLWDIPDRIRDPAAFEEAINKSLREHNPDYWRARQAGIERAALRRTAPTAAHHAER